jgi:hypothetical protein
VPEDPALERFYRALRDVPASSPLNALDRVLATTVELLGATSAHALFFETERGGILRRECTATAAIDQTLAYRIAERAIASGKVVRWPLEGHEIACAPIEAPHPVGALFIHSTSLSEIACLRVEIVARAIASIANRLTRNGSRPTLLEATDAFSRQFIEEVIERHGGNVSSAARELGVRRGVLYARRRSRR